MEFLYSNIKYGVLYRERVNSPRGQLSKAVDTCGAERAISSETRANLIKSARLAADVRTIRLCTLDVRRPPSPFRSQFCSPFDNLPPAKTATVTR